MRSSSNKSETVQPSYWARINDNRLNLLARNDGILTPNRVGSPRVRPARSNRLNGKYLGPQSSILY